MSSIVSVRHEMNHPNKKVIIGWTTAFGRKHPIFDWVEDKENQIGVHFQTFPVYCCRECGRKIIPYSQEFEGVEDMGARVLHIFGMAGGYCRLCAYKEAKKHGEYYIHLDPYITYNIPAGSRREFVDPETHIPTGEVMEDSDDFTPLKVMDAGRYD